MKGQFEYNSLIAFMLQVNFLHQRQKYKPTIKYNSTVFFTFAKYFLGVKHIHVSLSSSVQPLRVSGMQSDSPLKCDE